MVTLATVFAVALAAVGPGDDAGGTEPIDVRVVWDVPSDCPDENVLIRRVAEVLGRTLRFDPGADASIEGSIRHDADGTYRLLLVTVVRGQRETRRLEAPVCAEVVDASALVVGLALEPFASAAIAAPPDRGPSTDPRVAVPPAPRPVDASTGSANREPPPQPITPTKQPPPTSTHRRRAASRLELFVDGAAAFGLTRIVAGGVVGGIAWQRERARVELSARHWFAGPLRANPSAQISLTAGAARACFVPGWGRIELPLCGGVGVGGMRGEGRGTRVAPDPHTAPWAALLAGVGGTVAITRWLLFRAGVELGVVPSRPRFHLRAANGDRNVYLASPVNARVTLGLATRFVIGK